MLIVTAFFSACLSATFDMSLSKFGKRRKVDDECRVFNAQWTSDYFFVQSNGKALCLVCQETVSVLKEYNIRRHYDTNHREKMHGMQGLQRSQKIEDMKNKLAKQQSIFMKRSNDNIAAVRASYHVAQLIADKGKPFTDGEFVKECMMKVVEEICPEKKSCFSSVSLSANTTMRRIEEMADDLLSQLASKAAKFEFFSLALDESTDVSDTAQLLIFIRGVDSNFEVTEELAALKSLKGTTTGDDIFQKVAETMNTLKLNWNNLRSMTTDGAPNMVGKKTGLAGRIKAEMEKRNAEMPIQLHCIIHQQALCSKVLRWLNVMGVVVSSVNYIRSHGLNHRQFQQYLSEVEAEYGDVLYHTEVRWLSRGKVLKRFFDLRAEIRSFLDEKGKSKVELSDPAWIWDLAFLADITQHLNELNLKLQGKGKLVCDMFADVKAFESKLQLFLKQISESNLTHFPCCLCVSRDAETGVEFPVKKCVEALELLQTEICKRFQDFHSNAQQIRCFQNPFDVDIEECDSGLQMELIELQASDGLKDLFKATGNLITFYASLPPVTYENLKKFARSMVTIFGSSYVCEQTFSRMKFVKSRQRTRLTDEHLHQTLRMCVSNLKPDITSIVTQKQAHCSH